MPVLKLTQRVPEPQLDAMQYLRPPQQFLQASLLLHHHFLGLLRAAHLQISLLRHRRSVPLLQVLMRCCIHWQQELRCWTVLTVRH